MISENPATLTSAQRLVWDYEELFEPLTSPFCNALLDYCGGTGPGDRVIDVAAGTGALSVPVARTGASLVACDISPAAVERLSQKLGEFGERAEARIMDGEALPLQDGSFDVAFSAFGVMLFPDFRRGLAELLRVTRPGGRVAVAVWAQREGSPAAAPFRSAFAAAFPDRPLPEITEGVAVLSDCLALKRALEESGAAGIELKQAEFPWIMPSAEWVSDNAERLFRDHPMWVTLSSTDRQRLGQALAREVESMKGRPRIGRAWLAVGIKGG